MISTILATKSHADHFLNRVFSATTKTAELLKIVSYMISYIE